MSIAYLEVDTGDLLAIINRNSIQGGHGLIVFDSMTSQYESDLLSPDSEDYLFLSRINSILEDDFRMISNLIYSGDWDKYTEYDYEIVKAKYLKNVSKEEFLESLARLNRLWKPLDKLQFVAQLLYDSIKASNSIPRWITDSQLLMDLEGLKDTITLAKKRDGQEARIKVIYG